MVVVLRKPVRLVADRLAELQRDVRARQPDRLGALLHIDQLFLLGQRDHHRRLAFQQCKRFERGVQLAQPAVDDDDVGVELLAIAGLAIPAAHNLPDARIIVVAPLDGLDAVASVLALEGLSVDEADLAAHRLAALQVGDVDAFDAADRLIEPESLLEREQRLLRLEDHALGLGLPPVGHLGAVSQLLDGPELVAQGCRLLVLPLGRRGVHLFAQLTQHLAAFAREEPREALNILAVRLPADLVRARRGALVDRVEQTRPKARIGRVVGNDVELAGSELEDALEHRDGLAQRTSRCEWPVDLRALHLGGDAAVFLNARRIARDKDAREVLARRDDEIRKSLVVRQAHVEARPDVFDEPVLGEERLPLALAEEDLEVMDVFEELLLLAAEVSGRYEVA